MLLFAIAFSLAIDTDKSLFFGALPVKVLDQGFDMIKPAKAIFATFRILWSSKT